MNTSSKTGLAFLAAFLHFGLPVEAARTDEEEALREARARVVANQSLDEPLPDGNARLHLAAIQGWERLAGFLLDNGASVDVRNVTDDTPLHLAAEHGRSGVLTLLLRGGAHRDARNVARDTALHLAVEKGHVTSAVTLLQSLANPNLRNLDGRTPLMIAEATRNRRLQALLIKHGALREDQLPNEPPPHEFGDDEAQMIRLTKAFLEADGDIDALDASRRETRLHHAVRHGWSNATRFLLDRGADSNAQPDTGALELPMLGKPANPAPLHLAAASGHTAIVELLIERGATVDLPGVAGSTALHLACAEGHEAVALTLLAHGASRDARDTSGFRPLHLAVQAGSVPIATRLIERGADVRARSVTGSEPMHLAAGSGNVALMELLLDHGADVNARDVLGSRPLTLARSTEAIAWLERHGAER
ncbi:MAG: ankyrin repeat domain-containing protein [Planctomycetes bacterium]|nr:ankyrin repeat domain-containing protein [Planctomycetota bacterium]